MDAYLEKLMKMLILIHTENVTIIKLLYGRDNKEFQEIEKQLTKTYEDIIQGVI